MNSAKVDFKTKRAVVTFGPVRTTPEARKQRGTRVICRQLSKCSDMSEGIPRSTITCPECRHAKEETMPTDACQWFYECECCKTVLRPKAGDCCVFCSYGTSKCPSIQMGAGSCCPD